GGRRLGRREKGRNCTHPKGETRGERGRCATAEMATSATKRRPGLTAACSESRPKNSPARGASQNSGAAATLNRSKTHKNHIGPLGQNGSAIQCDQNADQLGSTAVTR